MEDQGHAHDTTTPVRVGTSTFGFLYTADLERSLGHIAEAGYQEVEIAANAPHIMTTTIDAEQLQRIRRTLDSVGLRCVSINPVEMNLISSNPEIRELCLRHYLAAARVLAELGGKVVVVVPGRYNALIPMPEDQALALFDDQIGALLEEVRRLDLTVALETTPFGFLASTPALVDTVGRLADPRLGIALDVANIFPGEDIADAVRATRAHLEMVQFSGTWRDRWAHASIREGELDFDVLRVALEEIGYQGPCIYELVDGADPAPRLGPDLEALERAGWSR